MIYVDSRTGSVELAADLEGSQVTTLQFADVAFVGHGPEGKEVLVGIEIKTIQEALSTIHTGRFAGHQLPGLVTNYDYSYFFVQGAFKYNYKNGLLSIPRTRKGRRVWDPVRIGSRKFLHYDFDRWLCTMETMGNLKVRLTESRADTLRAIRTLYRWWTDKEFSEHRSHLVLYEPAPPVAQLTKPSLMRRIAAQIPSVGWTLSERVEGHFHTINSMVNATPEDWDGIEGIGKTKAETIVRALQGNNS